MASINNINSKVLDFEYSHDIKSTTKIDDSITFKIKMKNISNNDITGPLFLLNENKTENINKGVKINFDVLNPKKTIQIIFNYRVSLHDIVNGSITKNYIVTGVNIDAIKLVLTGEIVKMMKVGEACPVGSLQPVYINAPIVVDGQTSDWGIITTRGTLDGSPIFAKLFQGPETRPLYIGNTYLRYNCTTGKMYVLLLSFAEYNLDTSTTNGDNAWGAVDTINNKVYNSTGKGEFYWIYNNNNAIGYEASFDILEGSYSNIILHVNGFIPNAIDSQTFATPGFKANTPFCISCPNVPVCSNIIGTLSNEYSYTRKYDWSIEKFASPEEQCVQEGDKGKFNYQVKVNETGFVDSAWVTSYILGLTNPNNTPVTVNIYDNNGNLLQENYILQVGYNTISGDVSGKTDGTFAIQVKWDDCNGQNKQLNLLSNDVNPIITYINKDVKVTDVLKGDLGTLSAVDSDPKISAIYNYELEFLGTPNETKKIINIANILNSDSEILVSASATIHLCTCSDLSVNSITRYKFTRTYNWDINKDVDTNYQCVPFNPINTTVGTFNYIVNVTETGFDDNNYILAYNTVIFNSNSTTITNINVTQYIVYTNVENEFNTFSIDVNAGETRTISGSTSINVGATHYKIVVSWIACDGKEETIVNSSELTNPAINKVNDVVTVLDDKYNIQDNQLTAVDNQPYSSKTFNYPITLIGIPGEIVYQTNTACVKNLNDNNLDCDSENVALYTGVDLLLTDLYVIPTFDRKYLWNITKTGSYTISGSTVTLKYQIGIIPNGYEDSNYKLSYSFKVLNNNNVTLNFMVSYKLDGSYVILPNIYNIPAKSSIVVTGTVVTTSLFGDLILKIDWSANNPTCTTNNNAIVDYPYDFTLVNPNEINKCVNILDNFNNGVPNSLGSTCVGNGTIIKTDIHKVALPNGCVDYSNTATIVETGQTASTNIRVCGPVLTGARTIGFWQNKNGQKIITDNTPTTTSCNLKTYLQQFSLFSDINTVACNKINVYVTNIINYATATNMYNMLKAQMLATALNVYFSSTENNNLNAPSPIGNFVVNLTHICTINGCAPLAFNHHTSDKVSDLLTITSTNVLSLSREIQELAKNTYDDINNERAYTI